MFSSYNVYVMFMLKVMLRMLRMPNETSPNSAPKNKEESTVP